MKKIITSGLVTITALSSLAGTINSVGAANTTFPQYNSSSISARDTINDWMPNVSMQQQLLKRLIKYNILPSGSTVNDITPELLQSIPKDANQDFGVILNEVADPTSTGPDAFKGLENLTQAKYGTDVFTENPDTIRNMNLSYLPDNPKNALESASLFDIANGTNPAPADLGIKLASQLPLLNINGLIVLGAKLNSDNSFNLQYSGNINTSTLDSFETKTSDFFDKPVAGFNYSGAISAVVDASTGQLTGDGGLYSVTFNGSKMTWNFIDTEEHRALLKKIEENPGRYALELTSEYITTAPILIYGSIKYMSFNDPNSKSIKLSPKASQSLVLNQQKMLKEHK